MARKKPISRAKSSCRSKSVEVKRTRAKAHPQMLYKDRKKATENKNFFAHFYTKHAKTFHKTQRDCPLEGILGWRISNVPGARCNMAWQCSSRGCCVVWSIMHSCTIDGARIRNVFRLCNRTKDIRQLIYALSRYEKIVNGKNSYLSIRYTSIYNT